MVAIRKFLFDNEFDGDPQPEPEAPPPPPTFSEAELAQARDEGMEAGRAAARAEAERSDERRTAEALEAIAGTVATLAAAQAAAIADMRHGAMALAAAIARKIAPELARRGADDAVANLVADRLPDLMDEPRLVIRLDETRIDAVKDRLEAVTARVGYAGKLIFLAADGLDAPDCRIEWADGGVERMMARVSGEIDRIVEQYLAYDGAAPEPQPTES